jgi:VanZ family protein
MIYRSPLWWFIWAYIAATYLSLPFMRSILSWIKSFSGPEQGGIKLNVALVANAPVLVFLARGLSWSKLIQVLWPLALIGLAAYHLDIPEERLHFLQYGLLGVLLAKTARKEALRRVGELALFAILIGMGDEFIQWWLPNRVGDWRDAAMNGSAGVLGLWIGIALFWHSDWRSPSLPAH